MKWIDALKGLGILLVVAGHIFVGDVSRFIYVFHMPLFFIVGGMLFDIRPDKADFFYRKVTHLIVPYISFLLLIKVVQWGLYWVSDDYQVRNIYFELASMVLGGPYLTGWTGVFWFVTCFFITQQLVNYILCEFTSGWAAIIFSFMYVLATINSEFNPSIKVPLGLNLVLIAGPFFYLGYLYKKGIVRPGVLLSSLVILSGAGFFLSGADLAYDIKYTNYGVPFFSFILSAIIVFSLVELFKLLESFGYNSEGLAVCGSASMVVMYLHQPIQLGMTELARLNDQYLRFLVSVSVSLVVYYILKRFVLLEAFFLGNADALESVRFRVCNSLFFK